MNQEITNALVVAAVAIIAAGTAVVIAYLEKLRRKANEQAVEVAELKRNLSVMLDIQRNRK